MKDRPGTACFGTQYMDGFVQGAPYIAHEYLNLGVKFDPRLEPRFTGVMLSRRDRKSYEDSLKRVGLSRAWGDACLDSGHLLQRYYQKQGIESARLDPMCDGYCFWTIVDGLSAETGQGLYNAFWEPKSRGATPEQFRKFNGPTAILMRSASSSPIAVTGETIGISWWISHFGDAALQAAKLTWVMREGTERSPRAAFTISTWRSATSANLAWPR